MLSFSRKSRKERREKFMNLKELAKITGYSLSTVSKVFSDGKDVSAETKAAVIKKAKELGCFYKYDKKKFGKKVIAVICPEITSAYYTVILEELKKITERENSVMLVSVTDFSLKTESELIGFYSTDNRADGIIVIAGKSVAKKYNPVPIVYIGSSSEQKYADVVSIDFYSGIREAVYVLREAGHEKIGFIGERLTIGKQRLFEKAMKEKNLTVDPSLIVVSDKRFEEAGYDGMEKLFSGGNLPTAILASYDYIALGVITSLQKHGLKCPDDISLIGMDNIKIADYYNISLSSIETNAAEITGIVTDILYKKMNRRGYTLVQHVSVKSNLILRNSVKKRAD